MLKLVAEIALIFAISWDLDPVILAWVLNLMSIPTAQFGGTAL